MKARYRESRHEAGDYIDVDIYPVFDTPRSSGRVKKMKPSSECQQKLNKKNAAKKFIRLLNNNFTEKDICITLTYNEDKNPDEIDTSLAIVRNYLRRVKRLRSKLGLPELKYACVTEQGSKKKRIHHHIIMNGGIDINTLSKMWGNGYTQVKPLMFDKVNGLEAIGKYLLKDSATKKSWSASRNLKKPKVYERTGVVTAKKSKDIFTFGIAEKDYLQKLYPDCDIFEVVPFYNDVNGYYYTSIRMKRKEIKKCQKKTRNL